MKNSFLKAKIRETAQRIATGATGAATAVAAAPDALVKAFQDGAQAVGDTVQETRTMVADFISSTGSALGITTIVVGEVALFSAGVVPLIVFGNLPIKLGSNIEQSIEKIAKFVRGDRAQLMGINVVYSPIPFTHDEILAIIYDPHLPQQDSGGYIQISEEDIIRQLRAMTTTRDLRQQPYLDALVAVQETKRKLKIPLVAPDIRFVSAERALELTMASGPA